MQFHQTNDIYQVYLETGESVIDELTGFCKKLNILNGQINGIGAVKNTELGSYDLNTKHYHRKKFNEDHELISYSGNIILLDDEPFIHAHAVIGNHDMQLFGGHVFKMDIAVVGEFIIQKFNSTSKRSLNDQIGLAVWDLKNE